MNTLRSFKSIVIMTGAASLLLTACGKYGKTPASDIQQLRDSAKKEDARGLEQPQVQIVEKIKEVPHVVTKEVPRVEYKIIEKITEQTTVNESMLVIIPDEEMNFVEGQKSTFKVRGRVTKLGAKIKLTAANLPQGATFEADPSEGETYLLTWQPALSTVPTRAVLKKMPLKIIATVASASSEADRKLLEKLTREKSIDLLVFHDQTQPSDVVIENLPSTVNEGTLLPFEVTVKIPGIDGKSPQKPRLDVSYDGVATTTGNDFLELDGSRHVVADANNKDVDFLGDSKWRFHLLLDTKNVGVQPQLAVNGTVLAKADGSRVRMSFKVYSPLGTSSAEVVKQLKIMYNKSLAAPRFDFTALGEALLLTPGETIKLIFNVTSADPRAEVKVQLPDLKGLVGSPTVTCANSRTGASIQVCKMSWSIPCSATDSDLKQDITFSASASTATASGETVTQVLKTSATGEKSAVCLPAVTQPTGGQ